MTLKILCVCPLSQNLDFTVSLNDHRFIRRFKLYSQEAILKPGLHLSVCKQAAQLQTL